MADISEFNPFQFNRPEPTTETRTFSDPSRPNVTFDVTLRSIVGQNAQITAFEKALRETSVFVNGKDGAPPAPLPPPIPPGFKPSEYLMDQIGKIMSMQVTPEGKPAPDIIKWLWVSEVFPRAFVDIVRFAEEVQEKAPADLKNAFGATDTATLSDQP